MTDEENKKALLNYIIKVLEPQNEVFGNLPVCPFVKKERLKNKILFKKVIFGSKPSTQIARLIKETFKLTDENTLLIYDPISVLGVFEFIEYGKKLCEIFSKEKIISISLHPNDTFNIHGFPTRMVPFPTLLIQTASQISAGKEILQETDYYKNWTKEDLKNNYNQFAKYL